MKWRPHQSYDRKHRELRDNLSGCDRELRDKHLGHVTELGYDHSSRVLDVDSTNSGKAGADAATSGEGPEPEESIAEMCVAIRGSTKDR